MAIMMQWLDRAVIEITVTNSFTDWTEYRKTICVSISN